MEHFNEHARADQTVADAASLQQPAVSGERSSLGHLARHENLAGIVLGPYALLDVIGRGSAGTVYRAYHAALARTVAVKVARDNAPGSARRFYREARTLARLSHPHILPIYDYGEHDSLCYLVMPYVEGSLTLASVQAKRPLEPEWALNTMATVLRALHTAHCNNIVHRDLKPSNVLLRGGSWPLLADFGIAALSDESSKLTLPGQIVGTTLYMAPERALGRKADARSDVYAAGVLLYELLAGRVPFMGAPLDVLSKHVSAAPPPLRSINAELHSALEPLVMRALAKNPAARYPSAAAMADALSDAAAELGRPAVTAGDGAQAGRPLSLPLPIALLLLLLGVLAAGLLGSVLPVLLDWLWRSLL